MMPFIGRRTKRRGRRRALTLLECTLAMVIVPMAVSAVAVAIVTGQSQAAEALRQTRAASLAESLMEQTLALPYEEIQTFCDGFEEQTSQLCDAAGALYPEAMQRFERTIVCQQADITVADLSQTTSGLAVTVTVSQDGVGIVTLYRFVAQPAS